MSTETPDEGWIVLLEKGVWLAATNGDPGRTCVRESAERFESKQEAAKFMAIAQTVRPFVNARVEPVEDGPCACGMFTKATCGNCNEPDFACCNYPACDCVEGCAMKVTVTIGPQLTPEEILQLKLDAADVANRSHMQRISEEMERAEKAEAELGAANAVLMLVRLTVESAALATAQADALEEAAEVWENRTTLDFNCPMWLRARAKKLRGE